MSPLSEARRAELLAYCKLVEFADDPEVASLIGAFYGAAVGYLAQAGISEPPEGTPRRAQYDLCVNHLVLDSWDRREMTVSGTVSDNPAFRRMVNQLKMTEPPGNVSNSDTFPEAPGGET